MAAPTSRVSPGQFSPATAVNAIAPTLSDTVDDPAGIARALYVIIATANLSFVTVGGDTVVLATVPAFTTIPIGVRRVNSTGTTAAANLLLLY